jgi:sphingomyelin phosphodiesterase 2
MRKDLENGKDTIIDMNAEDPRAKRLDYIFFSPGQNSQNGWEVTTARVGMTQRHPELKCSLSDHFSIETTITRTAEPQTTTKSFIKHLPTTTYDQILDMTRKYMERERTQRKLRIGHFFFQLSFSIGCLIGVWWVPHNYVSFILMLLSSVGLSVGVTDGLMGFLFVGSELRALREFEWEIVSAKMKAESDIRDGKAIGEGPAQDSCLEHQE